MSERDKSKQARMWTRTFLHVAIKRARIAAAEKAEIFMA